MAARDAGAGAHRTGVVPVLESGTAKLACAAHHADTVGPGRRDRQLIRDAVGHSLRASRISADLSVREPGGPLDDAAALELAIDLGWGLSCGPPLLVPVSS